MVMEEGNENNLPRYLVFVYDQYYPSGGWSDLIGYFINLEDAEKCVDRYSKIFDNVDLIDLHDMDNYVL